MYSGVIESATAKRSVYAEGVFTRHFDYTSFAVTVVFSSDVVKGLLLISAQRLEKHQRYMNMHVSIRIFTYTITGDNIMRNVRSKADEYA